MNKKNYIFAVFFLGISFYLMRDYIYKNMSIKFITVNILFSLLSLTILYLILNLSKKRGEKLKTKVSEEENNKNRIENFEIKELNEIILKYYLQKRELETAKESAETQAKAKEIFLQNMSHEIRTPLNGIVIMSEILKYTELNEKQKRYVTTIIKVSNTLMGVINNILDYSKLQVQNTVINKMSFNIRELIGELKLFFISGSKEELFIIFTVDEDIPELVIGDSFRLKQVLINIIGNAIKFTKKGAVKVEVKLKKRSEQSVILDFVISDTGIGIREDKKGELFKSFMQADESISRRYGGTGLGLAISKKIIEAMSGNISVETEIKKGSKFLIELPFTVKEERKEEKFDNEKVIIVETRADINNILLKIFSQYKLETYICESKEEAEEIWEEFKYNNKVIILRGCLLENNKEMEEFILNEEIEKNSIIIKENVFFNEEKYKSAFITEYPLEQQEILEQIKCIFGYKCSEKSTTANENEIKRIDKNIAVIEDNDVNAMAIGEMIEKFGARVTIFENGIDALKDIKKNRYDLIISDIQLPDLSGFELLKLIRESEQTDGQKRKIIALTAHALAGYKEKCMQAGFDDYLAKPVTMKELYKVLAENTGEKPKISKAEENSMEKINIEIMNKLRGELKKGALNSFEKIKNDLEDKNYKSLAFEIHKLKGSFGNAKETEIYEMLIEMEKNAKEENSELLKHYESCFKLFKERFEL